MKKILVAIIFLACYAGTCEKNPFVEGVYRFWVKDNSGNGFGFLIGKNYPDTTIPDQFDQLIGVPPNQQTPVDSRKKWEDFFEELPADTLSIFIFSGDTLQRYTWSEIRSQYKILKRYDLSLQDLKNNNYTITYP